jgi:signal transduction histidine kinase
MSQQLIHAQEDERARIARELHDDIGQRLSLLMMNLRRLCDRTSLIEIRAYERRRLHSRQNNVCAECV